jgi:hypothetical protein
MRKVHRDDHALKFNAAYSVFLLIGKKDDYCI